MASLDKILKQEREFTATNLLRLKVAYDFKNLYLMS